MLEDLLRIKRRREDDAIAAAAEARRSLERSEAARDAKERELEEYRRWHAEEKVRLYEQVHGRSVTRARLESYREEIGLLSQRELSLEEELAQAHEEAGAREAALREAKRRRMDAHREVVKFEEYQRTLDEEAARAAERKEETEAEDVLSRRP